MLYAKVKRIDVRACSSCGSVWRKVRLMTNTRHIYFCTFLVQKARDCVTLPQGIPPTSQNGSRPKKLNFQPCQPPAANIKLDSKILYPANIFIKILIMSRATVLTTILCCIFLQCHSTSAAFLSPKKNCDYYLTNSRRHLQIFHLSMSRDANSGGKHNDRKEDQPQNGNSNNMEESEVAWESLNIRVARMRLEEENKRRFLKSRPAKLSYDKCKQWAQAQNMWHSREEWYDWIDQGEGLSAYIPSDPETFFARQGTWISWDDFLGL